jgi:hypothetical protein
VHLEGSGVLVAAGAPGGVGWGGVSDQAFPR